MHRMNGETPNTPQPWVLTGALALTCAAAFGTFVAWLSYELLCDENCVTRPWELDWQLYVACAGLVVAVAMTWSVITGRARAAGVCLVAGLVLYAAWAVLLDAATHGWGKGPVPF